MSLKKQLAAATILATVLLAPAVSIADTTVSSVSVPSFYQEVMKMKPEGKLGELIKQEKVETPIAGAQAWRIAYVSSDVAGNKTIATGIVVAPIGAAPAEGRPVVWLRP